MFKNIPIHWSVGWIYRRKESIKYTRQGTLTTSVHKVIPKFRRIFLEYHLTCLINNVFLNFKKQFHILALSVVLRYSFGYDNFQPANDDRPALSLTLWQSLHDTWLLTYTSSPALMCVTTAPVPTNELPEIECMWIILISAVFTIN